MYWNNNALSLLSKGQTTKKATSLGELSQRRNITEGQFWTPNWVSQKLWAIAQRAMKPNRYYSVMDNSIGSGRLLAHANPEQHILYGCDIDGRCIDALSHDAQEANFNYTFSNSGVENIETSGIGFGFINPAFSLLLSSPNLFPFDTNTYGKFGPKTHALSHEYCLQHALNACDVVFALLPLSMNDFCKSNKTCLAILHLPDDTFKHEGAKVKTAVYVFTNSHSDGVQYESKLTPESIAPHLPINARSLKQLKPKWNVEGIDESTPTITLPVTGDKRVELHHKHNRIVVKYHCGLTQAIVANGLLRKPVEYPSGRRGHRYPKHIQYCGSGKLFIDTYLMQDEPKAAFNAFLAEIQILGGEPVVSPTLAGYFEKRCKRLARELTPFRKVVETQPAQTSTVTAKRAMMLRPLDYTSPAIKKGEQLLSREGEGGFYISKGDVEVFYDRNKASKSFDFTGTAKSNELQWTVINEGKNHYFPHIKASHNAQLSKAGVSFLWEPQKDSVIEAMMTRGAVIGWEQGCGKARGAIALCLSSTAKHNLIAVEGGLVDEMVRELEKIDLNPNLYRIITSQDDVNDLRKINIVSYNKLKAKIGTGKRTLSHLLRRRFGLVAADEGGILSNPDSQQSRALLRLSPRRIYLLDGTPIGSYPRDLLPMAVSTQGSGTAHQPYSLRNGLHMQENLINTANYTPRGLDAFRDDYVVLDWATSEFTDNLRGGAKREIPMIGNVPRFRQWADLVVQRRLRNEPDMAQYAGCKRPIRQNITVQWDSAHFDLYIKEAVEFSHWFMNEKKARLAEGKGSNLQAVLARIQAVINTANYPHIAGKRKSGVYSPVTSKQRAVVNRIKTLINTTDDKIIVFAKNPETHNRLHEILAKEGIDSVLFTGQQNIEKRTAEMNKSFRFGNTRVLLSSYVGQRGLNLEQANRVIMYNRAWTGDTEEQAIARTTRPNQTKQVEVEYFHLSGSIDEYMAMVVDWKIAAARTGLDYGEAATVIEEFRHSRDDISF